MSNEDKACTLTLPDGTHFDLSSLSSATADYIATAEGVEYKLNVCRAVVSELWKVDDPDTVGGFVNRKLGDFSLGKVNSTLMLSPGTNDPLMILENGSPCPISPLHASSTAIRFVCAQNEFSAGTPRLVAALPPGNPDYYCSFFFEWPTHVACPTTRKAELEKAHYIAFGAFLLIAFLTWFFGHTLYNRFYLKRSGAEIFPFPSLKNWKFPSIRLPWSKSNGSGSTQNGTGGGFGWRRRNQRSGGYSNIRADDHDEEERLAARFSLDDDDDLDDLDAESLHQDRIAARALGEEANAWRGERSNGVGSGNGSGNGQQPKVGVHQGLVDI